MLTGTMRTDLYQELYRVEDRHWWHQQKRKIIHRLIKLNCPKAGRVLDVGCGGGKLLTELQALGWQTEGVDAPSAIALAQKRGLKISGVDLQTESLPFRKNYFDLIVCLDTLEHMENDKRLVKEMTRIVKPKGKIIISVPAYQTLFSYWDKMLGHFRRYNRKTLTMAVNGSGLKTKFISYFFSFLLLPAILIRLAKVVSKRKQQSDFMTNPLPIFSLAIVSIFGSLELLWLKKFTIPLGLSLVGVFEKK